MTSTTPDFAAYEARCTAIERLEREAAPSNKTALFDALVAAGITHVTVTFDGYGDSGQIESANAFNTENAEVSLPATNITIREPSEDLSGLKETSSSIRDVIDAMVYDLLEATHSGWEDGEGAFGEFSFDVADRTILLEYNERYTETHYSTHEF